MVDRVQDKDDPEQDCANRDPGRRTKIESGLREPRREPVADDNREVAEDERSTGTYAARYPLSWTRVGSPSSRV